MIFFLISYGYGYYCSDKRFALVHLVKITIVVSSGFFFQNFEVNVQYPLYEQFSLSLKTVLAAYIFPERFYMYNY